MHKQTKTLLLLLLNLLVVLIAAIFVANRLERQITNTDVDILPVTGVVEQTGEIGSTAPAGGSEATRPAEAAGVIPQYGIFEQGFTAGRAYGYTDAPRVEVRFTGTNGAASGLQMSVRAFWNGGANFVVRFSPPAAGDWSFTTSSSEGSLNGISGGFTSAGKLPGEHVSYHGPVVNNPQYPRTMMHADGTPFFWMGDTQWSFSTAEISWPGEFQTYVNARAAQGFNYVHGVVYQQSPAGNDDNEGGQAFTGNNVDQLNPGFFQAFDQRVSYLNQQGIVAGLTFAWANEGWQRFKSEAQVERYAQYLIDRYGAYNVVWITSGEYEEGNPPGGHNNLGNYVKDNDPYQHPRTIHPVGTSGDDFGSQNWLTIVYQQLKDDVRAKAQADLKYGKPVVNGEYGYENDYSLDHVRSEAWRIMMGGGFFVYGNLKTFHADAAMSDGNLKSPGAAYMTILRNFFTQKTAWWELNPDSALLSGDGVYGLTKRGTTYVFYTRPDGAKNFQVDLKHAPGDALFAATWVNPMTGAEQSAGTVQGGRVVSFTSPFSEDGVLLLTRSGSVSQPILACTDAGANCIYFPAVIKNF